MSLAFSDVLIDPFTRHSSSVSTNLDTRPDEYLLPLAITPPPNLCPYSQNLELRFLVDENLHRRNLVFLSDCGAALKSVKEAHLQGEKDSVIFDYAVAHQLAIVTKDRGFASYLDYDQSRSFGILIVPGVEGEGNRKEILEQALAHFAQTASQIMASRNGIVASYLTNGRYKVTEPDPEWPSLPRPIMSERYING